MVEIKVTLVALDECLKIPKKLKNNLVGEICFCYNVNR